MGFLASMFLLLSCLLYYKKRVGGKVGGDEAMSRTFSVFLKELGCS